MYKAILVTTCFFLLLSQSSYARLVTSDSDIRTTYEKLVSCKIMTKPFYGQRSWTEQTVSAQLSRLNPDLINSSPCHSEDVQTLIERLKNQLADHLGSTKQILKFHNIEWRNTYLSGGTTAYPSINFGAISANKNPLLENQRNQLLGEGLNTLLTTEASLFLKDHEIFLRPQAGFLLNNDDTRPTENRATLEQAYFSFNGDKWQVIAGHAPLLTGQGESGGFLFSENARSLDHFFLTNSRPIVLPWLLKYFGDTKYSVYFGTLGPDQNLPWTLFAGPSLGCKPWASFEMNLSHVIQFGGENSNSLSTTQWLQEFFGFIPGVFQSARQGANKITEIDFRFFWDRFMGTQIYLDYTMDDVNRGSWGRFKRHFTHNSSYQVGFYSTRFLNSLSDSFRLEGTLTAPIAYRHSEYTNGWTINNNVIGNSLGPDGAKILLQWDHDWRQLAKPWRTTVTGWWEKTDNNWYNISTADGYTILITDLGPDENRWVIDIAHQFRWENWSLKADFAFMHTVNTHRVDGNSDNNARVDVLVKIPFAKNSH